MEQAIYPWKQYSASITVDQDEPSREYYDLLLAWHTRPVWRRLWDWAMGNGPPRRLEELLEGQRARYEASMAEASKTRLFS